MLPALREVFSHVSARRRRQLFPLLLLVLLGAIAELVSIGAILPVLGLIADPAKAAIGPLRPLAAALGASTPFQLILAAALAFAIAAIVAGAVRLLFVWASQRFVNGVARELSTAVYRRVLHQPYSWHTAHNSSETLAAVDKAQAITNSLLVPLIQGVGAAVIALFILIALVAIDPVVALASGLGFAMLYLLVMGTTREIMRRNGQVVATAQKERLQAVNEGLGGIRDLLLDHSQEVFARRFEKVEFRLRRAHASNGFLSVAPRFIVEGLGVVLIVLLALLLSMREGGLLGAIPVLGALALGAQRLVPLLQQLYYAWSASLHMGPSLEDVLALLRLPQGSQSQPGLRLAPLPFARSILLRDVAFTYPGADTPTFSAVNVEIPKGARVGIVGRTGSGKSTLVDVIMGLLPPSIGAVVVDGRDLTDENRAAWQARIAHVPQAIYLTDGTIAENIAFGVPQAEIDEARVRRAGLQAELAGFIGTLPAGYATRVGERGIRLSGGQRQRIGIARALYRNADLLVFDEATNALDSETEQEVMRTIDSLGSDVTILTIAHRTGALGRHDIILHVEDGRVMRSDDGVIDARIRHEARR